MTKLSLGLAFITIASVFILSGCDNPDSTTRTNPDFNRKSIFTDYGTYGRTVYFEDDKGETWCYYDLLTFNNPEYIELTVSHPMPGNCSLDNDLPLVTYKPRITGEIAESDSIIVIQTIMNYDNPASWWRRDIYNSETGVIENDGGTNLLGVPYSVFIEEALSTLKDALERDTPIVSIRLEQQGDFMFGNLLSISDYLYSYKPLAEHANSNDFWTSFVFYQFVTDKTKPDPEISGAANILANPERSQVYRLSPYQKLSPSEDNPYPLDQIEVSSVVN